MAAPSLFDAPVDNHGLFADHYLKTRFPQRDDVQALREEADAAFEQVRERYQSVAASASSRSACTSSRCGKRVFR